MALTNDEIKHIAHLARIRIPDDQLDAYRVQLSSVLEYVAKLQEVDTSDVPELAHAAGQQNVFRSDEPETPSAAAREAMLSAFPHRMGDLLEVQAVFENKDEAL